MGALPKNKITRVERGKRRAGNKRTVTKDLNRNAVPLHKRGFVAQLLNKMGMKNSKVKLSAASRSQKQAKTAKK